MFLPIESSLFSGPGDPRGPPAILSDSFELSSLPDSRSIFLADGRRTKTRSEGQEISARSPTATTAKISEESSKKQLEPADRQTRRHAGRQAGKLTREESVQTFSPGTPGVRSSQYAPLRCALRPAGPEFGWALSALFCSALLCSARESPHACSLARSIVCFPSISEPLGRRGTSDRTLIRSRFFRLIPCGQS